MSSAMVMTPRTVWSRPPSPATRPATFMTDGDISAPQSEWKPLVTLRKTTDGLPFGRRKFWIPAEDAGRHFLAEVGPTDKGVGAGPHFEQAELARQDRRHYQPVDIGQEQVLMCRRLVV